MSYKYLCRAWLRERCKCSLAFSCSCVYFSAGNYSDYVWNEQSKNCPLHLGGSTTNTIAESGKLQRILRIALKVPLGTPTSTAMHFLSTFLYGTGTVPR